MANLTGVPMANIWGNNTLPGMNQTMLSEEEKIQRKKKMLAAGQSSDFSDAMSMMYGPLLNAGGGPRA